MLDMSPFIINETVLVAKEFLDGELRKYDSWGEFRSGVFSRTLFDKIQKEDFARLKTQGVGRETICKFLGSNWTQDTLRHPKSGVKIIIGSIHAGFSHFRLNKFINLSWGSRGKENLIQLISAERLATNLALSPKTLYAWAKQRKIPHVRLGVRILFDPQEIEIWVKEHKIKTNP